jgi:hypothetical protein
MLHYKMSALVLNDPNDHEFIRHMAEHMDELNSRTGKDFLFFSLVDPPKEWGGAINPRYRELCLPPTDSKKDRMMLYNFLAQVELDDVPLPGILLTTGPLEGNSCVYIHTYEDAIGPQLMALGEFCSYSQHLRIGLNDPDFRRLIDEISIEDPVWSEGLPQSIAESLRLVSAVRDIDTINEREAVKCIHNYLDSMTDEYDLKYLTTVANCCEVLSPGEFTHGCELYSSVETPFASLEERLCEELMPIRLDRGLDVETQRSLYTYNVFLKTYRHFDDIDDALEIGIDPSVLNSSLLKGVENELNLSVVQAMRKQLGIPMPEYYAKYCPNYNAVHVRRGNNHRIDLNCAKPNRNRRGDLESVSIGDVRGVYLDMVHRGQINCFADNDEFCNMLYQFSQQRNNHAGVDYQYLLECAIECNELMNNTFMPRYMNQIIALKEELSGELTW